MKWGKEGTVRGGMGERSAGPEDTPTCQEKVGDASHVSRRKSIGGCSGATARQV